MKTSELIQRVQSLYSRGVQSDDSRLSNRHIYNKLLTARAKLISQEAKKKQIINLWNYQTLPCVELIPVERHECPCLPPVGCKILKSKYPLPKPITDLGGHLIQGVTSIEGSVSYSRVDFEQVKYHYANKYTAKHAIYWIRNEHLYTSYTEGPTVISVTLLAENPFDAENFPSYCEKDCTDCVNCDSPLEMEFPIDNDMADTLVELAIKELVILFSGRNADTNNDNKDVNLQQPIE